LFEGETKRMSGVRRVMSGRGVQAAAAMLAAGGVLASVGIAGAAEQADVTVAAEGTGTGSHWSQPAVAIETGDSVTWDFQAPTHNVGSTNASPTDPRWEPFIYPGPGQFDQAAVGSTVKYTFYKSGTYEFVCELHGNSMTGTVTVTGEDQEIPSGTPTPEPTAEPTVDPEPTTDPNPTPTTQPGGNTPPPVVDDHTQTPAPGGAASADTTKPSLSRVKLKGLRRGARVRFSLSEASTVTLQFRKKGARKVLRTVRLQARAGTRTVRVRSPKLRKGRYTVTLTARDAMGNRSAAKRSALRIRR